MRITSLATCDRERMGTSDYPALYRSADQCSLSSQRAFFGVLLGEIALLVLAAVLSILDSHSAGVAVFQAALLLGALGCAIYLFAAKPDRYWYAARAVAESVKTLTWRYVSRAEPFEVDVASARLHFCVTLRSVVEQNHDVAKRLVADLEGVQITPAMESMRTKGLEDRKAAYLKGRVTEQQGWYAKKSRANTVMARRFFGALTLVISAGALFAIARVHFVTVSHWPTDVLVALATALLVWIQAKRFSELAGSYALAAHEISILREQATLATDDERLSSFVGDAENAFSREHTQWVARKDV